MMVARNASQYDYLRGLGLPERPEVMSTKFEICTRWSSGAGHFRAKIEGGRAPLLTFMPWEWHPFGRSYRSGVRRQDGTPALDRCLWDPA